MLYSGRMAYQGFQKVQVGIESKGASKAKAGAIAAAIGRKKYGNSRFQAMAAEGRKRAGKKG